MDVNAGHTAKIVNRLQDLRTPCELVVIKSCETNVKF